MEPPPVPDAESVALFAEYIYQQPVPVASQEARNTLAHLLQAQGLEAVSLTGHDQAANSQFATVAYCVAHLKVGAGYTQDQVRQAVHDRLQRDEDLYKTLIDECTDWAAYLSGVRSRAWGDGLTLQVICDLFGCKITVISIAKSFVFRPRLPLRSPSPVELPPDTSFMIGHVPEKFFVPVTENKQKRVDRDALEAELKRADISSAFDYSLVRLLWTVLSRIYKNHMDRIIAELQTSGPLRPTKLLDKLKYLRLAEIYDYKLETLPEAEEWNNGDSKPDVNMRHAIETFCFRVSRAASHLSPTPAAKFIPAGTPLMTAVLAALQQWEPNEQLKTDDRWLERDNFKALESLWSYIVHASEPGAPFSRGSRFIKAINDVKKLEEMYIGPKKLPRPYLLKFEHRPGNPLSARELRARIQRACNVVKDVEGIVSFGPDASEYIHNEELRETVKVDIGRLTDDQALNRLKSTTLGPLLRSLLQAFSSKVDLLKEDHHVINHGELRILNLLLRKFSDVLLKLCEVVGKLKHPLREKLRALSSRILDILYGKHDEDVLMAKGAALRDRSPEALVRADIYNELKELRTNDDLKAALEAKPYLYDAIRNAEAHVKSLPMYTLAELLEHLNNADPVPGLAWHRVHQHAIANARPVLYLIYIRVLTEKVTENYIGNYSGRAITATTSTLTGLGVIAGVALLIGAVAMEVVTLGIATPLALAMGAGAVTLLGLSAGGIAAAVHRSQLQQNYLGALRFLSSELTYANEQERRACLVESDVLSLERIIIEKWSDAHERLPSLGGRAENPNSEEAKGFIRLRRAVGIFNRARSYRSYLHTFAVCGMKKSGKSHWVTQYHHVATYSGPDQHTFFTQWYHCDFPGLKQIYVLDFAGLNDSDEARQSLLNFSTEKHYITHCVIFFMEAAKLADLGRNKDIVIEVLKEIESLRCPKFLVCNKMDDWWMTRDRDATRKKNPQLLQTALLELRQLVMTLNPKLAQDCIFASLDPLPDGNTLIRFKEWSTANHILTFEEFGAHVTAKVMEWHTAANMQNVPLT